jgi:hypothetical protein
MRQEKWVKYIVSWEKVPREKIPCLKRYWEMKVSH